MRPVPPRCTRSTTTARGSWWWPARREELEAFKAAVKEAGGKALPLAVGGGFHSPFMEGAAEAFAGVLARFAMQGLRPCPCTPTPRRGPTRGGLSRPARPADEKPGALAGDGGGHAGGGDRHVH